MIAVKGSEFIKRIQKLAKERGLACSWHPDMGKGSHGVLKLGDTRTIVRNPKDVRFPRFFVFQPIGIMPPISVHAGC